MNATPIYGSGEPKQIWRRMNTDLLPFTCNSSHIHVMLRWRNNYANEASKFLSLLSLCRTYFNRVSNYGNETRIIRDDVGKAWTQKPICRETVSINTITCANFPLRFAAPRWFTTSRSLLIIGMILLWHWVMDQINCVHPMHYAHEYPRLKDQ